MSIEQREFIRLMPRANAFAALGREIVRVGKIKDICRGGSCFEYITNLDLDHAAPQEIDIFLTGDDFYLSDLPCNIIYDAPVQTKNVFTSPVVTKRCGVQFGVLSDEQQVLLDYFMQNHIVGLAPSSNRPLI